MNDLPETLEQLSSRIDALEKRLEELEHLPPALANLGTQSAAATLPPAAEVPSGEQVSSAFLVLGKAMLGIAGAYVLRALAEAAVLPRLLVAAIAIGYAIAWLVAASRTPASRFAAALYAATSALILAPMLWELTMRFHVLAPGASAAVLGLLVATATALNWKKENSSDFPVAFGAAALTALALSVVTHVMIAFLVLLLVMFAVCELRFIRSGMQGTRMIVAAIADCAVWFLIVVYRDPASVRGDYPALGPAALLAPACLLFLITAASVVYQTAVQRRKITGFETVQSMVSFLLWMISVLFLVPQVSGRIVGMICLVFAAACYAGAFGLFRGAPEPAQFSRIRALERRTSPGRNHVELPAGLGGGPSCAGSHGRGDPCGADVLHHARMPRNHLPDGSRPQLRIAGIFFPGSCWEDAGECRVEHPAGIGLCPFLLPRGTGARRRGLAGADSSPCLGPACRVCRQCSGSAGHCAAAGAPDYSRCLSCGVDPHPGPVRNCFRTGLCGIAVAATGNAADRLCGARVPGDQAPLRGPSARAAGVHRRVDLSVCPGTHRSSATGASSPDDLTAAG